MKAEDERIAKPGILGSVIFILIFVLVLLWFGVKEEDPQDEGAQGNASGAKGAITQLETDIPHDRLLA